LSEVLDARAAIADLVHTYAKDVRRGNGSECARLFTEDAVFEVREPLLGNPGLSCTRSKVTGHDAIASYLSRTAAPEARICPLIHNLLIQVDGREATSSCVMTSIIWSTGQQLIGEYQDTYRYETGWRFASRVFTILGELPHPAPRQDIDPQSLGTASTDKK
jgi:SnoaL-like domain